MPSGTTGAATGLSTSFVVPGAVMRAISCQVTGPCMSVGAVGERGVAVSRHTPGVAWVRVALPKEVASLTGVACESVRCVGVGTSQVGSSPNEGVVISVTPGSERAHVAYLPQVTELEGVSCVAQACWAVGTRRPNMRSSPVGEVFVSGDLGATWKHQYRIPDSYLRAISCDGVARCTAVGGNASLTEARIAVSDAGGKSWRVRRSATVVPLTGVSCVSGAVCTAVGVTVAGSRLMAYLYRSSRGAQKWHSVYSRLSIYWQYNVSCASRMDCVATWTLIPTLRSQVISTSDAGRTWVVERLPADDLANDVACQGSSCLVAGSTRHAGDIWNPGLLT
jgi:hypothetical protein